MRCVRHHFTTIDSTNTWAKQQIETFDRSVMTVVTADYQTGGRGRFNRKWVAPPGVNLLATYCFFMAPGSDVGNVAQVIALCATKGYPEVPMRIRWPNDLIVHGKKIGGILCEAVNCGEQVGVCLGIGINVNMEKEAAATIDIPATSLFLNTGIKYDVENEVEKLSATFLAAFEQFCSFGFAPFLENYRHLIDVPERVLIKDGARTLEGAFHAIDSSGALILKRGEEFLRIASGEIVNR